MSTLLVDLGNTRVKWAKHTARGLGRSRAASHAGWGAAEFRDAVLAAPLSVSRLLLVSVAAARPHKALLAAAAKQGIEVLQVESTREAAGVTNGYREPWRLGADRWVALIGARSLFPRSGPRRRPLCVVDIGTAMTIDLLDVAGQHRGGAIVPGPELMRASLLRSTGGIAARASGGTRRRKLAPFSTDTDGALVSGAAYSLAAAIDRAVLEAKPTLGARPDLVVTGGAAGDILRLLRTRHRWVPDLVLRGLAQLA